MQITKAIRAQSLCGVALNKELYKLELKNFNSILERMPKLDRPMRLPSQNEEHSARLICLQCLIKRPAGANLPVVLVIGVSWR